MKYNFNLIILSLISSLVSSICFYFIIRIILSEDLLIINSFNNLFFKISTEELSIITLGFNAIFYLCLFICVLKTNGNNLKSKFKFIEYIFWVTIIIFIIYFYLQVTDFNELYQSYTDVLIVPNFNIFKNFICSLEISLLC